ncbi:hypothetical protein AKJ41_00035 [candidate division MSBL1 archaeon SCGC-AAA259O05]|uniref:ATP-dependent helicase n=1 Tax=candidate division MSBL1 archaeon SCGC-AAA259O05 TaxID=1698271 RepID=A0A133V5X2_9EURY|nr:hypothetical protein AKJ41_00035 [candidate division MSBL1 archaeon SCGC-AAA259O05]
MEFVEGEGNETLPGDFESYVKDWFWKNFDELTPPQKYSFNLIQEGNNSLICAPTGTGKTLSAFLEMINKLFRMGEKGELEDRIYVLYVSPLRALDNDIERNLSKPLEGIREIAKERGKEIPEVRAGVRTGDTPQKERSKQLEKPPHILITTPETLAILLSTKKFKENFKDLEYVIVDEIHSLCDSKRGTHLSLSLERLEEMTSNELVRIGLSATQAPIEEIGRYLAGYESRDSARGCKIIDVSETKNMDLKVLTPVEDLIHSPPGEIGDKTYHEIHDLIQDHSSTLIFTNTRSGTERVVNNLKSRWPDEYRENVGAHHSSMSREERIDVEESLKRGDMKVVVTSTSLELGIDIGYIDLVIQLGSPKGIARGVQRVGRSGHKVAEKAKGRFVVMDRNDALEVAELAKNAKEGNLDKVRIPTNCLDVLSQHIVGMGVNRKWGIGEAYDLVRRAYPFRGLKMDAFEEVLRYVAGEYAALEDQKVYGKIWVDWEDRVFGRRGKLTRMIYMTNIGTIPDTSFFRVHTRKGDRYVGTLDEEFLDRLEKGDIFTLGGSTYEFRYARGMKVRVDPKPDRSPTVPSWFSEMLPLSYELGLEIGKLRGKIRDMYKSGDGREDVKNWLLDNYYLDENTAFSIASYLWEQHRYLNFIPTHDDILVEETYDERGRKNVIFHTIYGRRVHDALSRFFASHFSEELGVNVGLIIDDNGFVLTCPDRDFDVEELVAESFSKDIGDALKGAVRKTELMKRRFRHVASRALMILRNYKGNKKSVSRQQMDAHVLLNVCEEKIDPDFPIIRETYREIMEDYMDVDHAKDVLEKMENGDISFRAISTEPPSPFAHGLVVQGRSDVMRLKDKKERLRKLHDRVMEKIEG